MPILFANDFNVYVFLFLYDIKNFINVLYNFFVIVLLFLRFDLLPANFALECLISLVVFFLLYYFFIGQFDYYISSQCFKSSFNPYGSYINLIQLFCLNTLLKNFIFDSFCDFLSSFLSSDMGPESLLFIFLIFAGNFFLSGISSFNLDLDLDYELEEIKALVSVFFVFY